MAAGFVTLLFSRSTYAKIKAVPFAFVYGAGVAGWLAALGYSHFVANTFLSHRFSFAAVYAATLGMLGLALTFPNSPLSKRVKLFFTLDIFAGSVFIGLIFFTNYVLTAANFSSTKPAPFSLLSKLYLLMLTIHIGVAVIAFVRRYLAEVRNRLYFNYIVLAFILLALIGSTTNLILPLAGITAFAIIGPLSAFLPFVTVVYALGITDINDISYVIAQLIQAGVRLTMLAALFVVGIVLYHVLGAPYYSSLWLIAMSIVGSAGAICVYLFGSTFDKYVEDKIAYSRMSPDKARSKLIMGLSGQIELDHNVSLVLRLVKQTIGIRAAGIALIAKDNTFWMSGEAKLERAYVLLVLQAIVALPGRHHNAQALINTSMLPEPIRHDLEGRGIYALKSLHTESGIKGLYVLGEKFSQEIFTRQDATLMHTITEISDLSIERALFYNQIQSFNATLQQRINHATQKLRLANTRLKTLDSMKDDFISMASHQLRSPATSVHEALQMLGQFDIPAGERNKLIELAEASSERLVTVITDMLSIARIQAGHFTIERSDVDVATLVDRAILEASGIAKHRGVRLEFLCPEKPIVIRADRSKVNEMMSNYIDNALAYSPAGSTVQITLKTAEGRVSFEVTDRGIGVPVSERKDLFRKFFRATNARKEQPNGNGIGLYVVKNIAQAHGGDAYYESQTDGSLFGFWLPI